MSSWRNIRSILMTFDFFPSNQFLCYKGQSAYSTATGGALSIIIIIIFFVLFVNTGLDVIKMKNVSSSYTVERVIDPTYSKIVTSPNGGFMLSVFIPGVDFTNQTKKYFDVALSQRVYGALGIPISFTEISMQLCTPQHLNFGKDLLEEYYAIGGRNWLCPPLGTQLQLQGRITSERMKTFAITVKKCNTSVNANCATDAQVLGLQSYLGSFTLAIGVVTTLINPSSDTDYKTFYLQDRNYFAFSTTTNIRTVTQIQQYQIQTDQSLAPYSNIFTETGYSIPELFRNQIMINNLNTYFQAQFEKSSSKSIYTRSFQKIDSFFSYVGGLVGTILGLIFVMSIFNEISYYISVGNKLFTYSKQQKIDSDQFNFIYFIFYLFYKIFNFFGCLKNCKPMKLYLQTEQQMKKQLDIVLLMRRVIYLERCISMVLADHQLTSISAQYKPTLEQAEAMRKKYHIHYRLDKKHNDTYINRDTEMDVAADKQKIGNQIEGNVQVKQKKEENWSQTSFDSFKSRSFQSLRNKIKTLGNEKNQGNINAVNIYNNIDPQHIDMLIGSNNQQNRAKMTNKSQFAAGHQDDERYFRQMQEKEMLKNQNQSAGFWKRFNNDGKMQK